MYEVGVHIADVSYFVKAGSALDTAASCRATSVYLVQRVRSNVYTLKPLNKRYNIEASMSSGPIHFCRSGRSVQSCPILFRRRISFGLKRASFDVLYLECPIIRGSTVCSVGGSNAASIAV